MLFLLAGVQSQGWAVCFQIWDRRGALELQGWSSDLWRQPADESTCRWYPALETLQGLNSGVGGGRGGGGLLLHKTEQHATIPTSLRLLFPPNPPRTPPSTLPQPKYYQPLNHWHGLIRFINLILFGTTSVAVKYNLLSELYGFEPPPDEQRAKDAWAWNKAVPAASQEDNLDPWYCGSRRYPHLFPGKHCCSVWTCWRRHNDLWK